ncbi:exported protein of unknown function [Nitrosotalea devaniterrae]|uniref:Uncharacterized protein n=1 Tax=Nitrosotalea devaniterrae TaxID=1078905 RepID=A0A128A304_9ARCH|nr:exported protein of unknown function [Candidatus Nitrosotalea devanaterra]
MRLALVIAGMLLAVISVPLHSYLPSTLSSMTHSFVSTMSLGNMNSVSMLRQMGYPSMHQILYVLQYVIIGMAVAGIGLMIFGVLAKKVPKAISVKLVTDESFKELHVGGQSVGTKTAKNAPNPEQSKVMLDSVNDVLGKLENELKDMKTGYEDHKQKIESEKKKLEQKQREKLAKIIATGEVLIKEITPDRFEERISHYVELKNTETGQLVDLSLLAEKFAKMKKKMDSTNNDYSPSEFESMKRFLDE